jgi:hypothetical protein
MSLLFAGIAMGTIVYLQLKLKSSPEEGGFETLTSMSEFNKKRIGQTGNLSPIRRNDSEFSLGLNQNEFIIQPGEFCKEGQVAVIFMKYLTIGSMITISSIYLSKRFYEQ